MVVDKSYSIDSPIANYRFDECEYTGASFEVVDQTGSYSATSFGGLDTNESGQIERFTDISDKDHHIETSIPLSSNFTVSLWFKKPTSTSNSRYFVLGAMASGGDLLYLDRDNNWIWGVYSSSTGSQNGSFSFASLDSNWHHLTLVYSGGQTQLYIDGTLEDTVNKTPTGTLKYIGTSFDGITSSDPQGFRAPLDEFMVFDSALSVSDIQTIYTNQNAKNNYDGSSRETVSCPTPLVLDMRFDEVDWSVANSVLDSSGNNYHANAVSVMPTEGFICNAADLSATGTSDYLSLDYNAINGLADFTLSAWVKTTRTGAQTILSAANSTQFNEAVFYYENNTTFWPTLRESPFFNTSTKTTVSNISTGVWKHHVWTRKTNVNNGELCLYIDNVLQGCSTHTNGEFAIDVDATGFILGQEQDSLGGGFESYQGFSGLIDEVLLFNRVLSTTEINDIYTNQNAGNNYDGTTRADCLPQFDHFEIDVIDGQGLTCEADNITIKACADTSCSTLSTDATDVQLSINGTFNKTVTVSGGSTDTSFSYTDVGIATLSLDQTYECANGGSTSCDVTFADAGFRFLYGTAEATTIDNQTSGDNFAGIVTLQAVEDVNGVCTGLFSGDKEVELSQQNIAPGGTTGLSFVINNAPIAKYPTYTNNVTLNFDSDSKAVITTPVYLDAGQIRLHAKYDVDDVSLAGNSNDFWVSPASLVISAKEDDDNDDNADGNDEDINGNSSSADFTHTAGESFDLVVTAVNSSGTTTPNYEPGNIQLKLTQTGPITGDARGILTYAAGGSITSVLATATPEFTGATLTDFEDGVSRYSVANYSEVGLINLDVQDEDYDKDGDSNDDDDLIISSASAIDIGRFIPDHFDVSIPSSSFKETCVTETTKFTYIGQPFLYLDLPKLLITAKNSSGTPTQNYTQADYQKLEAADIERTFPEADSDKGGEDESTKMVVSYSVREGNLTTPDSEPSSSAGDMTYTFNSLDSFTYTKDSNSLVGSFTTVYDIVIDSIEDSDDVNASIALSASALVSPTGVNLRFGRWTIENTFGPETSDLPVPMKLQYWDGDSFETNTFDTCTVFDSTYLTADKTNLSPGTTRESGSGKFSNGLTQSIILSAPGTPYQGAVPVIYEVPSMPWLLYDWSWNGSDLLDFTENPSATATFGIFRGNDRIIYQREIH